MTTVEPLILAVNLIIGAELTKTVGGAPVSEWLGMTAEDIERKFDFLSEITSSEYRTLLPVILMRIRDYPKGSAESTFVQLFLEKPFKEFVYHLNPQARLIDEFRADREFISGWVAPLLSAFSAPELEVVLQAINALKAVNEHVEVDLTRELARLENVIRMALGIR